jgi:hypothetical protein
MNNTRAAIIFAFFILGSSGHSQAVQPLAAFLQSSGVAIQTLGNPNAADAAQAGPEFSNYVYYVNPRDHLLIPLERETPEMGGSTNSLTGAVKGHMLVQGQKSVVRLKLDQRAEFEVRLADPSQQFGSRFERFEAKDGTRFFKFGKDPKPSNSADRPGLLVFDTQQIGKSSIKFSVPYELPPGEYGFTISGREIGIKAYCFGVDPP